MCHAYCAEGRSNQIKVSGQPALAAQDTSGWLLALGFETPSADEARLNVDSSAEEIYLPQCEGPPAHRRCAGCYHACSNYFSRSHE